MEKVYTYLQNDLGLFERFQKAMLKLVDQSSEVATKATI